MGTIKKEIMKISREDESHLEKWLGKYLEELHQPSPESLSKYIIALLKQDMDNETLKQNVLEELKTFLKDKTSLFVNTLFVVLSDGSYRTAQPDDTTLPEEQEEEANHHSRRYSEDDYDDRRHKRRTSDASEGTPDFSRRLTSDRDDRQENYGKRKQYEGRDDQSNNLSRAKQQQRPYPSSHQPTHSNNNDHPHQNNNQNGNQMYYEEQRWPMYSYPPNQPPLPPGAPPSMPPMSPHSPSMPPPYWNYNHMPSHYPLPSYLNPPPYYPAHENNPPPSHPPAPLSSAPDEEERGREGAEVGGEENRGGEYQPSLSYDPSLSPPPPLYYPSYYPLPSLPSYLNPPPPPPSQPQKERGGGGRRGGGRGAAGTGAGGSSLPEHERCTLKCTGIPPYVKEGDLRGHFEAFGGVVELQLTGGEGGEGGAESQGQGGEESKGEGGEGGEKRRVYSECLVQFYSSLNAKKCLSSPLPVLNNRFIRLYLSPFNILPPADAPPQSMEERERDLSLLQQEQINPQAVGGKPRGGRPSFTPGTNKWVREKGGEKGAGAAGGEGAAEAGAGGAEGVVAGEKREEKKGESEVREAFSQLKELSEQNEQILKKKEQTLMTQMEECRKMMSRLEEKGGEGTSSLLSTLEGRVVDLQQQLRGVREALASPSPRIAPPVGGERASPQRFGRGRGGRGFVGYRGGRARGRGRGFRGGFGGAGRGVYNPFAPSLGAGAGQGAQAQAGAGAGAGEGGEWAGETQGGYDQGEGEE